ncbi:MAG: hypothetical protein ACSLFO_09700 [Acidimicrobiales bacterium]
MATRIRASCAECGDVELRVDDVQVRVCADDNAGSYVFRCPRCDMAVVKDAEQRVVDLLLASGVSMTTWTLPAELREHRLDQPAFTHDDLLDFHAALATDGWLDDLLGPAPDPNSDRAQDHS